MAEAYELEDAEDRPEVPAGVIVRPTVEEVIEASATDLFVHAMNCVRAFGDFHLALTGGRTPVRLYQALMLDPQFRSFPWKRSHLWVVSERAGLPSGTGTSELLRDLIVHHSDLPREQFHPMDSGGHGPGSYAALLRETLGWREPGHDRLDYVLLGVGADGSTAGMPAGEALPDDSLVHETGSNGERHLSLGLRLINASRLVAVLATGTDKRSAVRSAAMAGSAQTDHGDATPIQRVRPIGGELRWYVDDDAILENAT